jgi:hypothetical protein
MPRLPEIAMLFRKEIAPTNPAAAVTVAQAKLAQTFPGAKWATSVRTPVIHNATIPVKVSLVCFCSDMVVRTFMLISRLTGCEFQLGEPIWLTLPHTRETTWSLTAFFRRSGKRRRSRPTGDVAMAALDSVGVLAEAERAAISKLIP